MNKSTVERAEKLLQEEMERKGPYRVGPALRSLFGYKMTTCEHCEGRGWNYEQRTIPGRE